MPEVPICSQDDEENVGTSTDLDVGIIAEAAGGTCNAGGTFTAGGTCTDRMEQVSIATEKKWKRQPNTCTGSCARLYAIGELLH